MNISHWSQCADTVTFNQEIVANPNNGTISVTPESLPQTYTLRATNSAGTTVRSVYLYPVAPTGTLAAYPSEMKVGDSTTLTWTSSRASSCSITPDIGPVKLNGSMTITPSKPTKYRLTVQGSTGTAYYDAYVGFVKPMADLKASALTINQGETVKLTWVYSNATSSVINQGIGGVELGGERTVAPATTTTYTMTATGPGGTTTDSVTINVVPSGQPPIVSLTASPGTIIPGQSSVLSWESSYTDSLTIEPEISVPVENTGSATVTPDRTTTYIATATGPGGMIIKRITVVVLNPPPTLTLSADPPTIMAGESARLSWTSSDADTITFNQGIGPVLLEDFRDVNPEATTLYTATAIGPGGTVTKNISLKVTYPTPTVTFSASPQVVIKGEGATLTWETENAESVIIRPNIGSVQMSGSSVISSLTEDTTYIITVIGKAETITKSLEVTIARGTISGTITDLRSGDPLAEASISVTDAKNIIHTVQSGADGTYTMTDLAVGNFSGSIIKAGYEEEVFSGTIASGETLVLDKALSLAPPTISNIAVSNITGKSAVITWDTDQPADSFIEFGETVAYGQSLGNTTLTTTHRVEANNLFSGQPYHFKVMSTNAEGLQASSDDNAFATQQMFVFSITEPVAEATINRPNTLAKGTITSLSGKETGVVVNGLPAMVNGNEFAINHVPLQNGANTITATATDVDGNIAEISIALTAQVDQKI